jgi:ferredoxin
MAWSELEASDGLGQRCSYQGPGFCAQLDFDCHGDARKLEIRPTTGGTFAAALLEHLKPFGEPVIVVPGQLAIIDRAGYFRLYVSPGRLQAQLRKEAPRSVIAELLTQLERAQHGASCAECPRLCHAAALGYDASDGGLRIDSRLCTHCLDCVHHHLELHRLPPAERRGGALTRNCA